LIIEPELAVATFAARFRDLPPNPLHALASHILWHHAKQPMAAMAADLASALGETTRRQKIIAFPEVFTKISQKLNSTFKLSNHHLGAQVV